MKPIKITPANAEKIEDALYAVNGLALSFTISRYHEVADAARAAEARLSILPKADHKGAKVGYTPAGPSANSYKYAAKTTCLNFERRASGWFLTGISEGKVFPKSPEYFNIAITAEQAAEMQRRVIADFFVKETA